MADDKTCAERMPHSVIVRAPGLLPMLYKVRELAEELGISRRTIRRWARSGMPHQRDGRNHIWVNGEELAEWVEDQRRARRGPKLKADEGYCFRCRRAVRLVGAVRQTDGRKTLLQGTCPRCGATVSRGVKHDLSRQLPEG
jgi:excisionase family DNA binding protein